MRGGKKCKIIISLASCVQHKVDITEGARAQFSIWIFNFWPYGQLSTEKNGANYEQLLRAVFSSFHGQNKNIVASALKRFISFLKIGYPLNPECKRIESLRQVLFYLFCGVHSALLSSTPVAQKETCTHTSSQCFHLEIYISQLLGSKYIFTRQPPMRCWQDCTVKKQHGKKSTTILLVFCQQNLYW